MVEVILGMKKCLSFSERAFGVSMLDLSQAVEKLTPLLTEYVTQSRATEDRIRLQGTISLDICGKCSRRNIVRVDKMAPSGLDSFLKWLKENEIRGITSSGKYLEFRSPKEEFDGIKGNKVSFLEGLISPTLG